MAWMQRSGMPVGSHTPECKDMKLLRPNLHFATCHDVRHATLEGSCFGPREGNTASSGTSGITLTRNITLGTTEPEAINLTTGKTLNIIGNGDMLSGGGTAAPQRGLSVYAGTVSIASLSGCDRRAAQRRHVIALPGATANFLKKTFAAFTIC